MQEETSEIVKTPPYEISKIKNNIGKFIEEVVYRYHKRHIKSEKLIHGPLWGTAVLRDHEIAILDLPLIQRLRQIHQTSLSYLTYPAATHSRFEHTLGVLIQADKLINSLRFWPENRELLSETKLNARTNIRLASILHDCGHGPLSHASEEIYQFCDDMQALTGNGGPYEGNHPHEVLAHLIITHEKFRGYIKEIETEYDFVCDLDKIADSIIGKSKDDEKYMTQIVNGPFDADKIDYIFRDSHFSGLPLVLDLERLWYSITIDTVKKKKILVVKKNGMSPLEQILFCKIMLFSTIYHHPKVRATDCMFKGVIEYIRNHGLMLKDKKLNNATDFLWVTDNTFFSKAETTNDKKLHDMIHSIMYRRLFLRALTISIDTIEENTFGEYKEFQQLDQRKKYNYDALRKIAEQIWKAAKQPCLKEEVWVDIPSFPSTKETDDTFIQCPSGYKVLTDFFPSQEWIKNYIYHKWKAHVFCPATCQKEISKAAKDVLQSEFKFKFNDLAQKSCHI